MKQVNITDFRSRVAALLSEVEEGEEFLLLRHGRAVARVSPVRGVEQNTPSWKSAPPRLVVKGGTLSAEILEEHSDADIS
ncbi:MAG: type II toxin-antitoxin system Phd/YefM family antitoxin [Bacteroidetes bacterium]|nr:type II toxin-antitoxin system Phd/YefM family antitoxin [Bacteroidota bacterium]